MNQESFCKGLLIALQSPEIRTAFKSIIGEQVREELQGLKEENALLKNQLKTSNSTVKSLQTKIHMLQSEMDSLEQYSRRSCLRITGLPEHEDPNTSEDIIALINGQTQLDPPLLPSEVDRAHRIGPRNDNSPRNVIIKFRSYPSRKRVMDARKKLKPQGNNRQKVFINEDLTRERQKILYRLRMEKRKGTISDCWTHDGTVVIRDMHRKIRSARTLLEAEDLMASLNATPVPPSS